LLVPDCPTQVNNRAFPDRNLSGRDYAAILLDFEVRQMTVDVIIDADTKAIRGNLDGTSRELSGLISRPTTTLSDTVRSA
jgi:NAD(P)H dehydrogenase (quinone)